MAYRAALSNGSGELDAKMASTMEELRPQIIEMIELIEPGDTLTVDEVVSEDY